MPDLTIEPRTVCASVLNATVQVEGSKGDTYTCTWGPPTEAWPSEYQRVWSCTCPGYQYRGKCKHTATAEESTCNAGADALVGGAGLGGVTTCPECGGSVAVVEVAV